MSFALKVALTLALTVLVATGTVSVLVNLSATQRFEEYVGFEMRPWIAAVTPLLVDHFSAHKSWEGAEAILENPSAATGAGRRRGAGPQSGAGMQLVLANAQGSVVIDPTGHYAGERLSTRILSKAQPIMVEGSTVGYLLTSSGPREQEFIQQLDLSVVLAGVLASLVAILLGLLLTRAVLRPLRLVRDAARRIGSGELAIRIPVSSGDEVGELAGQFNEMAAALERDEQMRRTIMADIAHELRTPVSVIRGQVEALQDGVFELTPENVTPIHDQALLLGRLIDDLRDLALADAGRLPLERAEVDLTRLLRRVVDAFRPQALPKRIGLLAELPDQALPVHADAQRLEQIVANLLSNALRYTPAGGEVHVRAWAEPSWSCFAVEDNGIGITSEDLPRIFERFFRADRARTRAKGGTGLGLAIVHELVQAHGGRIAVQSAPGRGATFTVYLPQPGASAGHQPTG